jgi:hypothetical protein
MVGPNEILHFARLQGSNLHQLHITFAWTFGMSQLRELLLCCPMLTDVKIWTGLECWNDGNENLPVEAFTATSLQQLQLIGYINGAMAANIMELAANCPQLVRLEVKLYGLQLLTDDWLASCFAAAQF